MNRKVGLVALIGPVVALSLTLTGCSGFQLGGNGASAPTPTSSAASTTTPTPSSSAADTQAANDHATVKAPSVLDDWAYPTRYVTLTQHYGYDTHKKVNDQAFPIFQIGSNGSKTIWPDSVRDPLTDKSAEEVVAHVLAEPDYCAHIAVGLYHTTWVTPSGAVIVVKADNPWLKKWFPTDISKVNDWAMAAMAGDSQDQLRTAKKCALVGAYLELLKENGVQLRLTSLNYHIATDNADMVDGGNPFGTIREFALSPYQYVGEFVVLEFQLKAWPSNCVNQILINTGDGRFARPDCTPPATPPTTTPPTGGPLCPGQTLTLWPNGTYTCKGLPTEDPSHQGNNKPGGNGSAGAQPDKEGAPAGGAPATVYTVPDTPASGIPVGSTPSSGSSPGPNEGGGDGVVN
ncbi:hypothetical protein EPN95_02375 [Patescibacteria group bacterium]|nr:MAG: hypothetical protein EPN95_02375 [Patescibacteria group bacterium]